MKQIPVSDRPKDRQEFRRAVLATPAMVSMMRACINEQLDQWGLQDLRDSVSLVASELLTNVIVHGRHGSLVDVAMHPADDGSVTIRIWDDCAGQPERRDADETDESGRGLMLVAALSEAWGTYRPLDQKGKVVWARCAAPSPPKTAR